MYTIRPAINEDIQKLKELNTLAFANNIKWDPDAIENWANTPQGENYFSQAVTRENGCFFVCEDEGQLIGYADGMDMEVDWRKSKYFQLINMGVLPERTKEGIGRALMDRVTEWAKEHGFQRMYLNCYIKNSNAVDFYRHLGYEEIDVCMERDI